MVGHGGSSAGLYLADPTSPIPSHCASIVTTSTLRVKHLFFFQINKSTSSILFVLLFFPACTDSLHFASISFPCSHSASGSSSCSSPSSFFSFSPILLSPCNRFTITLVNRFSIQTPSLILFFFLLLYFSALSLSLSYSYIPL